MKKFLIFVGLLYWSLSAHAEVRSLGFDRFGLNLPVTNGPQAFHGVEASAPVGGTLTQPVTGTIDSLHPYGRGSRPSAPSLVDELYYEPLMLQDPINKTERFYPLVARAIRYSEDFSTVTFELDPRARFQDGTPVQAEDVVFSFGIFRSSGPMPANVVDMIVAKVEAGAGEVRFHLNAKDQVARDATMLLARIRVVKANTGDIRKLGGVEIPFITTGPYRIGQLGRNRIVLVKNLEYWAENLPVRRGFFNFNQVEGVAALDQAGARELVAEARVNFYQEPVYTAAKKLEDVVLKSKARIQYRTEPRTLVGKPLRSFVYNLDRPFLKDLRVRRALLLAFDFEKINRMYYDGSLVRPTSLLEQTPLAPRGAPDANVHALLATCGSELPGDALGNFSNYGNNIYTHIKDSRERLRQAQLLLFAAGYTVFRGRLVKAGDQTPMEVRIAVMHPQDYLVAGVYKNDLQKLGIQVHVIKARAQAALDQILINDDYDIAAVEERFVSTDGWPRYNSAAHRFHQAWANPDQLTTANPNRLRLGCMDGLVEALFETRPGAQTHREVSEAIARLHQALYLNIYLGEAPENYYFADERLHTPAKLSPSDAHLYGYWMENTAPAVYPNTANDLCWELECLVQESNR